MVEIFSDSMSKKSKTQQTQNQQTQQQQQSAYQNTNTFDWMKPPETSDVQSLRDFKFTADPRIGYVYGNARNQAANSFNNPLGGSYSPQMRDQIMRSTISDLGQKEAQAYSEANQGLQGAQFAQRSALAAMTAPRIVQTGASGVGSGSSSGSSIGTGTAVQTQPIWGDLLMGGMTGGAA